MSTSENFVFHDAISNLGSASNLYAINLAVWRCSCSCLLTNQYYLSYNRQVIGKSNRWSPIYVEFVHKQQRVL